MFLTCTEIGKNEPSLKQYTIFDAFDVLFELSDFFQGIAGVKFGRFATWKILLPCFENYSTESKKFQM